MQRLTIYTSYSVVIYVGELVALKAVREVEEFVARIIEIASAVMGESMIGAVYNEDQMVLIITFKHRDDAVKYSLSWSMTLEELGLDPSIALDGDE